MYRIRDRVVFPGPLAKERYPQAIDLQGSEDLEAQNPPYFKGASYYDGWIGSAPSPQTSDAAAQIHQTSAAPPQHGQAAEVTAVPAPGPVFEVPLAPPSKAPAAPVQQGQAPEFCALPMDQEEGLEKPEQSAEAIAELKNDAAVKDRRGDLLKMQVALGGHDNAGAAAFESSQYTFGYVPSQPDKRSKEQKKADAKKLAVQRKEDERLKEKERKWQVEQRRLKVLKAEEEAEEVRQKLLRAQLGPTPTTAGGRQSVQEKPKAAKQKDGKSKWWKICKIFRGQPLAWQQVSEKPKKVVSEGVHVGDVRVPAVQSPDCQPGLSELIEHWQDLVNKQTTPSKAKTAAKPLSPRSGSSESQPVSTTAMDRQDTIKAGNVERQDTIKAGNVFRQGTIKSGQAQQQLLLSELKRVGTQQEQLKKAVSEAAAAATARGETFEISPLKSFKLSDEELANLKMSQLKESLAPSVIAPVSEEAVQEGTAENNVAPAAPAESSADTEAQMQLLFAELKRIEGQQQQLKTAVAQNKVLVVHPPKGFAGPSVEDEYAEEEEAQLNPDRFIPSGGLTGFNVAKDLLKLDFSSPEEAPEEFRAVVFNAPPAKKGMRMPSLTALEIQTQGSFGLIEEKGLNMFLRRLQEDQQDMLELIKDRERARKKGLHEQALPVLKVPAPAVVWDVGTPPSPLQSQGVDPSPQEGTLDQQAAAAPVATPSQGPAVSGVSIKKAAKGQAAALSRFGGVTTAAKAGDALPGSVAPTQPVPQGHESRAAPAVFAASPIPPQTVTPSQLHAAAQQPTAASNASSEQAVETIPQPLSSTPQQTHASPSKTQHSEQVEPSAYSVFAKPNAKATTKAASKAAAKGESEDDDVELSPEELGFAGHSEDAFAALKAKMAVAQGKKSKKKDKKEAAAAAAAATSAVATAAVPMPATAVADSAAVAVPSADTETGTSIEETDKVATKQSKHEEKEERERRRQEEKQKKKEAKQQQELQEQLEKQKKKEAKQLKEQQEQEEKQRKKQLKKQETQREQEEKQRKKDSQAAEGEEQQHPEEEEEVGTQVQAAKGNSVSDAPVPNLAAGVQLGFTPSSAGKSKKKNK
ncbi:hypothetical protein WJX82_010183 [Trebouxia sp. C0006]